MLILKEVSCVTWMAGSNIKANEPGLTTFVDLMFALDGTMNFDRNSRMWSLASSDCAYDCLLASAGKVGLVATAD